MGPRPSRERLLRCLRIFKGSPYNKAFYVDLLCMLYEILAKVRKEGLMSIEGDIENPEGSPILSKVPGVHGRSPRGGFPV
jgi:chemotaxis protein MotA